MSDDVKVHIGAEEDVSKAVDSLIDSLKKLKQETNSQKNANDEQKGSTVGLKEAWGQLVIGYLAAKEALGEIIKFTGEAINAFAEHETGIVALTAVLAANTHATNQTIHSLMEYAQGLQDLVGIDDDVILRSQTLLAAQNLTEAQIKRVTLAAVELSKSGLVGLEQAQRGLASSIQDGSVGMLSRYIPALRGMTEEQLKAGAAIDYVTTQFQYLLPAVAETTQGVKDRLNEMWNDQKERWGEVFAQTFNNAKQLASVIQFLGDAGVVIFTILTKGVEVVGFIAVEGYKAFAAMLRLMVELVIAVGKSLWAPLQAAFPVVMDWIRKAFIDVINFLIDQVEWLIHKIGEGVNKASFGTLGKGMMELELGGLTFTPSKQQDLIRTWAEIWSGFADTAGEIGKELGTDIKDFLEGLTAPIKNLNDEIDKIQQNAKNTSTGGSGQTASGGPNYYQVPGAPDYMGYGTGGGAPPVADAMAAVGEYLLGFAKQIKSLSLLLDPLNTILTITVQTIAPFVDEVMAPLVGILAILGKMLGAILIPAFKALEPVITLVGHAFIFLYNYVIMPFANFIILILNLLQNIAIALYNFVDWLFNGARAQKKFVNMGSGMLEMIDESTLTSVGADVTNSSGASYSSNTTVTKPPDVYITINIAGNVIDTDLADVILAKLEEKLGMGARAHILEANPA